jgi:chemotaxis protein CheD
MGPWSRKVILDPQTGDAFCKRGQTNQSIAEAEKHPPGRAEHPRAFLAAPKKTDIELF